MKILKINPIINTTIKLPKQTLTKVPYQPKIDMFCKSKEVFVALRNKFLNLRDSFSETLYPNYLKYCIADWNFYINSTDENLEISKKITEEFCNLYRDEKLYKSFKSLENIKLPDNEKRQLNIIIKNFEEELTSGEDLKVLREKESEIAKIYNSHVLKIDNKEISRADIRKIYEYEKNIDLRKKAYLAELEGADLIAEDIRSLVKLRNDYAKTKGYENYFIYKLKEEPYFDVDIKDLENLLDEVYTLAKDKIKTKNEENDLKLAKTFDIKKEDLKNYHRGLLLDDNPEKRINESFESREEILDISKKAYKGMGYDLDKYIEEGKLTLDLYPRKGKNTHGFCFGIDAQKDARILANLTNNSTSLDTLMHELGHCVYTLSISRDLPFIERDTFSAINEAIAMMMGDLQKRENILQNKVSKDVLNEFKNTFVDDELKFISKSLTLINFEKQMYENPEQDLQKLWHDLKVKYQNRSEKEDFDNGWALIPHFLSHPAYYQNYFRATLMKAQIYNHLVEKFGSITENKNVSEYLKENLLKYGMYYTEKELIKNLTGKEFSARDFIENIK